MDELSASYNTEEWYSSMEWQHRWIEYMAGWWAGTYGKPTTVCDFGAGDGWWPHTFRQMGSSACYAIELHPLARRFIPEDVYFVERDLRKPFEDGHPFDLCICLEVAEHLPELYAETLAHTLSYHVGQHLLFSAAGPGQEGTGHLNLQPPIYWQRLLRRNGVRWSETKTEQTQRAFRNILSDDFKFLAENVMVFARVD